MKSDPATAPPTIVGLTEECEFGVLEGKTLVEDGIGLPNDTVKTLDKRTRDDISHWGWIGPQANPRVNNIYCGELTPWK